MSNQRYGVGAILATMLLVSPADVTAKRTKLTDEDRTYVEVFQVPAVNSERIFTGSKQWIAENFKSAKAVIEYEDKAEGTIIGNGSIRYPCKGAWDCVAKEDWRIRFTMRLEARDERFRASFTNITLYWPSRVTNGIVSPAQDGPIAFKETMDEVTPELQSIGKRLSQSLTNSTPEQAW